MEERPAKASCAGSMLLLEEGAAPPSVSLVVPKAFYFALFAMPAAWTVYLPLYFHDAGLDADVVGALAALRPLSTLVFAPLLSAVADRTGRRRETMWLSVVLSAATLCAVPFAPPQALPLALLVGVSNAVGAGAFSLGDAAVTRFLSKRDCLSRFGETRLYGALSFGWVVSPIAGVLLDQQGFVGLVALYAALVVVWCVVSTRMEFDDLPASQASTAGEASLVSTVLQPNVSRFLGLAVCMGIFMGVIDTFLNVRLRDLGASGLLMGLSLTATCLVEVPMFRVAGALQERIGRDGCIGLVMLCYSLRLLAYGALPWLPSPWFVLIAQLLHGVTFAVGWNTGITYMASVAPRGLEASLQSVFTSSYWGAGFALGAVCGGALVGMVGLTGTFLACAALAAGLAVIVGATAARGGLDTREPDDEEIALTAMPDGGGEE